MASILQRKEMKYGCVFCPAIFLEWCQALRRELKGAFDLADEARLRRVGKSLRVLFALELTYAYHEKRAGWIFVKKMHNLSFYG